MISYRIKINEQKNDISFYLALESALTETNLTNDIFFLWDIDNSVICGRHQIIQNEVNLDYTNKIGCKVYRRTSGGGTVYADHNCFMFTFITRELNKDLVYQNNLSRIANSLKGLGLDVEFSGRNDLLFHEKKFSGNAIYFTNNYSILHGTFLYDTDITNIVKCCTPDEDKLISKGIKSVSQRVINLKPFLSLSKYELMDYLLTSIGDNVVDLEFNDLLTRKVQSLKKIYDSDDWIYGRNPEFTFHNKKRFSFGVMEIFIEVKKNEVKNLKIYGDFFVQKELQDFTNKFIGLPFFKIDFLNELHYNYISDFILDCKNEDFLELIFNERNEYGD